MSSGRCSKHTAARSRALLTWYQANGRKLPWRDTTDPYPIWVSEIMLQQTQVKTVLPRYLDWFERFPSIEILAAASVDDVLKQWEGLGYYRRARFLHRAAQMLVRDFDGRFPRNFAEIMSLPGIGRSTAGAISSFAFGASNPVLDGNVKRVLRRWHQQPEASDKSLWQYAQQAIDASEAPTIWNQAMMELGATCCSPRSPDCSACPVSSHCASAHAVEYQPENSKAVPIRDLYWRVHLHTCPDRGIWLQQRPDQGIWGGLWAPPISELSEPADESPDHIHVLTHRRLHLYALHEQGEPEAAGRWVASIEGYALPTGIHRLLERVCV